MTQIMMVQPAAPPAQTDVSQTGTSSGDQFSSHLDNAIKAGNKQDSPNTPTRTTQHTPKEDANNISTAEESVENSQSVKTEPSLATEATPVTPDKTTLPTSKEAVSMAGAGLTTGGNEALLLIAEMTPENPITGTGLESAGDSALTSSVADASGLKNQLRNDVETVTLGGTNEAVAVTLGGTNGAAAVTLASMNISLPGANVDAAQSGQVSTPITEQQTGANTTQLFSTGQFLQSPAVEVPLFSVRSQETPSLEVLSNPQLMGTQSKNIQGQEALLAQIQKIIDSSSETGIVTVKTAGAPLNSPTLTTSIAQTTLAAATSPETPVQQSSVLIEGNVFKTTGEKSEASLTSLRQDSQQQYYEAKINVQNSSEQNNSSDNKQQNESTSQQTTATPQAGLTQTTTVPASDYAQVAAPAAQPLMTEPLVYTAKPIMLPSGTVFTEDEVIQQLVERFQITKRQLETKLNIKLHPAELGELKIDLNLKDGHIRAVVVAQSLHVQEIIEKNLAKLRTAFEDQGFSIDEILVTSESDSVGDFDLFEKNLSGGSDYILPQMKKDNGYADAEFSLEEVTMSPLPSNIGVNVKA